MRNEKTIKLTRGHRAWIPRKMISNTCDGIVKKYEAKQIHARLRNKIKLTLK